VIGVLKKPNSKMLLASVMVLSVFFVNVFYFYPQVWLDITDADKFSGESWEKQLTVSIFDYLPIFAEVPPAEKAPEMPFFVSGEGEILEFDKGSNWQSGMVAVFSEEANLRLPLYYFPGFTLKVDGERQSIDYNNSLGLITLSLDEGRHEFNVQLKNTVVRSLGDTLTLVSFLMLLLWLVKTKHDDKKN